MVSSEGFASSEMQGKKGRCHIRYGNANAKSRKLDIADFLLDAASRNNPIVGAADEAGQLAECREDFRNKIP